MVRSIHWSDFLPNDRELYWAHFLLVFFDLLLTFTLIIRCSVTYIANNESLFIFYCHIVK